MAVVTTTVTPTPMLNPFQGLGDMGLDRSRVPRADVVFSEKNTLIASPGAGNNSRIHVSCILPPNFAYAVAEIDVLVYGAPSTWNATGAAQMSIAGGATIPMELLSHGVSDANANGRNVYHCPTISKAMVVPNDQSISSLLLVLDNQSDNSVAAALTFYVRFYQYNIEQVHHYNPNSPQLTR